MVCPQELDSKTLLLKRPHALVIKNREGIGMQAFSSLDRITPEGLSTQAAVGELLSTVSLSFEFC